MIENVHRKDLSTLEKGKAAYQLFLLHGINKSPKELANLIHRIRDKQMRPERYKTAQLGSAEKRIDAVCKKIGKTYMTIATWLEAISISSEIQMIEDLIKRIDEAIK